MRIEGMTAEITRDRQSRPIATVAITLDGGEQVLVTVHESLAYSNTINMEIDGDLSADNPSLRINLNDILICDTTGEDPVIESPRRPDWAEGV